MAQSTIPLDLIVTAADQAAANAKARNLVHDAVKQCLPIINAVLVSRKPPDGPLREADVDALSLAATVRLLRIAVRGFVSESARAWRVAGAERVSVDPVRSAPDDADEVP